MRVQSNTLLRAAIGAVLLPVVLVGIVFAVAEPAGGMPIAPELALVMLAETLFIVVLVQAVLMRMRKTSLVWYGAAYGVPFAAAGYAFSDGPQAGPLPVLAVLALAGVIGVALGLAQWTIVVWRNRALQAPPGEGA